MSESKREVKAGGRDSGARGRMGGQKRQDEEREGKPDQTRAVRAEIKVVLTCNQR